MALTGRLRLQVPAGRARFAFRVDGFAAMRTAVFSPLDLAVFVGPGMKQAKRHRIKKGTETVASVPLRSIFVTLCYKTSYFQPATFSLVLNVALNGVPPCVSGSATVTSSVPSACPVA